MTVATANALAPAAKFDGTLLIDGLDEKRAGRSDRDTVDALVEKLFAVPLGAFTTGNVAHHGRIAQHFTCRGVPDAENIHQDIDRRIRLEIA